MPVRSLSSSVLKWPDERTVRRALADWTEAAVSRRDDVLRVGYFGSYARGDWGVGSDLDLIVVVTDSAQPFERRSRQWDTTGLPVPADLLVYTAEEWQSLDRQTRFGRTLAAEAVWLYDKGSGFLEEAG